MRGEMQHLRVTHAYASQILARRAVACMDEGAVRRKKVFQLFGFARSPGQTLQCLRPADELPRSLMALVLSRRSGNPKTGSANTARSAE